MKDRTRRAVLRDALIGVGAIGATIYGARHLFDARTTAAGPVFDLRDADPDPVDATAAFQEVLRAMGDADGGILVVPPGTWIVNRTLQLDVPGMVFRGAGMRATTIATTPDIGGPAIGVTADGVRVERLTIRGSLGEYDRGDERLPHGVRVGEGAASVTLRDLVVEEIPGYAVGFEGNGSEQGLSQGVFQALVLQNVSVVACGNDGVDMKNYDTSNESCPTARFDENPDTPPSCNGSRSFLRHVAVERAGQLLDGKSGIDVRGQRQLQAVEVLDIPTGGIGINLRAQTGGSPNGRGAQWSTVVGYTLTAAADATSERWISGRDTEGVVVETGVEA